MVDTDKTEVVPMVAKLMQSLEEGVQIEILKIQVKTLPRSGSRLV